MFEWNVPDRHHLQAFEADMSRVIYKPAYDLSLV